MLAQLGDRYRRSEAHRATPARNPHRLAGLVVSLERNIAAIRAGGRDVDVRSVLELTHAVDVYERGQNDPNFAGFMAAAKDPNNFRHDVVVLTAAGIMADAGLGIEFVAARPGHGRSHDLRSLVSLRHSFAAEVKAPALASEIGPSGVSERGRHLIREALRDAADQLPEGEAGMLVLGGPFWQGQQLDHLVADARGLWEERGVRHPMLTAVMAVSTAAEMRRRPGTEGTPFDWSHFEFLASMHGRWITNPNYTGHLRLEFAENLFGAFDTSFRA